MKLDLERLTRYATRYNLTVRPSDGEIVVHFYNRHGSLVDVLDASEFAIEDPQPRKDDSHG